MGKISKILIICTLIVISKICFAEFVIRAPLHASYAVLDPTKLQDISSLWVSRQINCQLMRIVGGVQTLDAAQSIRYVTPTVLRFDLKHNVFFSDDTNLTSHDVIATFNYLKSKKVEFLNTLELIDSIQPEGEYRIIIKLKKQSPGFITSLSTLHYPIFSKSFIKKVSVDSTYWNFPIGCGAYKILKSDNKVLELSPKGKGLPVRFNFVPATEVASADLGKYDLIPIVITGQHKNLKDFYTINIFDPYQFYFAVNTKINPWKNKENRCALFSKLNPSSIQLLYNGTVKPAESLIPAGIIGYEQSNSFLNTILNQYKNKSLPLKKRFCVSFVSTSIEKSYRPEYIKMIQNLYPQATAKIINDCSTMNEEVKKQNCDGTFLAVKSNKLDAYEYFDFFSSKKAVNPTGYYDPLLTKQIIQSQNIADPTQLAKSYAEIVKKINDECLMYPLFTMPYDKIYIRDQLIVPGLGEGPINEYPLDKITLKNRTN